MGISWGKDLLIIPERRRYAISAPVQLEGEQRRDSERGRRRKRDGGKDQKDDKDRSGVAKRFVLFSGGRALN